MATIHIRDVPEETWAELVAAAHERGESVQAHLLALLEETAGWRCAEQRKRLDSTGEEQSEPSKNAEAL
ncbi:FitA-like ribbon-helix-helix domain-containing protein [Glycomyces tenuis]|uniref:FitA-like ribbon-helix-helix domain-containing protein n=1 Tax=Glycomyces tenuis TaxID=58116 RepID=UPI0012DF8F2C|nr:hypothetical protein [Glycomyces tenuis]